MYSFADGEGVNLPNSIRLTESRRMDLAGLVERMGERRCSYGVCGGT